ncbi:hypothetical protein [Rugosimonospora africana]|uniref:Alanine-rich protein n=1 Tax=Rugosimonospora africana TaxID=556532 RepID=A0A8J3QS31_9ACTN|nr:hypothetical protein [Rugosimonospora africana]GIH14660.1 hypothetical protein Raf01_28320 [Rugosimonospora africana]
MQTAAYLYPWDLVGDPAAADLVAGLGLDHVVLAAVYHGTRALTPRHPRHRVVVAHQSAAYYPVGDAHWQGAALRPAQADWLAAADPFGEATVALRAAGVPVHAWVVCNHVDLPRPVEQNVVNAYGDRYPWALCPARDDVGEYLLGLAADAAALPGIDGVELEACGWYGYDHLSAHDKVGGVPLSGAAQYLLSLCFCAACAAAYRAGGIDPEALRGHVRTALDAVFSEAAEPAAPGVDEVGQIGGLLGAGLAAAVADVRQHVADRLRAAVIGRIRAERPELDVLLHASPQPHRSVAFTGLDPARAATVADGLVVNCWGGPQAVRPSLDGGGRVYASLLAVRGMGGRPDELPAQVAAAQRAGAHGVRLYHAGLAGAADLAAIRELTGDRALDRD